MGKLVRKPPKRPQFQHKTGRPQALAGTLHQGDTGMIYPELAPIRGGAIRS
jgi:hypothetical protein